jgi:D-arabinose 1-dehydrogenase-like Zn-dependent alcohol dehydrogenase
MEHVCKYTTDTFNSKWPNGDKAYGGYANFWRGKYSFVTKIPDAIPSAEAAPMLCGGITGRCYHAPKCLVLLTRLQHSIHWYSTTAVLTRGLASSV